jgi:hypothetical protein
MNGIMQSEEKSYISENTLANPCSQEMTALWNKAETPWQAEGPWDTR